MFVFKALFSYDIVIYLQLCSDKLLQIGHYCHIYLWPVGESKMTFI